MNHFSSSLLSWVMLQMTESWHIWMRHGTHECAMAHMNTSWHIWMRPSHLVRVHKLAARRCRGRKSCIVELSRSSWRGCLCVLQCIAVYCSVLQCVAVCCSVLQCVAASYCRVVPVVLVWMPVCIAVCCSVLQCVAVCCSVLQCVTVWCSVLS